MQDLKEVTPDFHYENYRAQRLSTTPGTPGSEKKKRYPLCPNSWLVSYFCVVGFLAKYLFNFNNKNIRICLEEIRLDSFSFFQAKLWMNYMTLFSYSFELKLKKLNETLYKVLIST